MSGKMLECRDNVLVIAKVSVALKTLHSRHTHSTNEVRVFPECLFDAPPTRFARDVNDRCQRLVNAAYSSLKRSHRIQASHKIRIERCRQSNRLRKARRGNSNMPV